jgi:hypothetical protein
MLSLNIFLLVNRSLLLLNRSLLLFSRSLLLLNRSLLLLRSKYQAYSSARCCARSTKHHHYCRR